MPENVTYGGGYIRYIKSKRRLMLLPSKVEAIEQEIANYRLPSSLATRRAHVQQVRDSVAKRESEHTCTKCGSPMVMRKSAGGRNPGQLFWGCSSFPNCRHTASFDS